MSFYEWKLFDLGKVKIYVGLGNFAKIFSDKVFVASIINTVLIVIVCLIIEIILGLYWQ